MNDARQQIIVLALCLLAATVFVAFIIPNAIVEPRGIENVGLSPRFLPGILGGAIILLSAIGLVRAIRANRVFETSAMSLENSEFSGITRQSYLPYVVIVVLVACILLIPSLGMLLPSILSTLVLLWLGGERRWWIFGVVGLVVPVALARFFVAMLNVPLPTPHLFG